MRRRQGARAGIQRQRQRQTHTHTHSQRPRKDTHTLKATHHYAARIRAVLHSLETQLPELGIHARGKARLRRRFRAGAFRLARSRGCRRPTYRDEARRRESKSRSSQNGARL